MLIQAIIWHTPVSVSVTLPPTLFFAAYYEICPSLSWPVHFRTYWWKVLQYMNWDGDIVGNT